MPKAPAKSLPPIKDLAPKPEARAEEPEKPVETWVCPVTEVGDTIRYWPDGNTSGSCAIAIVTSVNNAGDKNITATRIQRNSMYLTPIEYTILHKDDPRLVETPSLKRHGVWDLTEKSKRLVELERRLSELES